MRTAILFLFFSIACLHGDGGVLLVRDAASGLSLFAEPVPLRVGTGDFSVLVQDPKTGQPLSGAAVSIRLRPVEVDSNSSDWAVVCNALNGVGLSAEARQDHSQNRLLYSAWMSLPASGEWEIEVRVRSGGESLSLKHSLTVAPAAPPWMAWWPWMTLVPLGVAGYVLRGFFLRQRRSVRMNDGLS